MRPATTSDDNYINLDCMVALRKEAVFMPWNGTMKPGPYNNLGWANLLKDDGNHAITYPAATDAYIELDYGDDREIDAIYIRNRRDCCFGRIQLANVFLYDAQRALNWSVVMASTKTNWKLPVNPASNGKTDVFICQYLGGMCTA